MNLKKFHAQTKYTNYGKQERTDLFDDDSSGDHGDRPFKQFDFATQKFEKPALAIVYFIGLAISIYLIFGKPKGQSKQ